MADPIVISSLDDPRVEAYRNVRDADLRGRDKLFMAESELVVRRLLRTPERLHSLFLSPARAERLRGEIAALPAAVPVYLADLAVMSAVAAYHVHRGVLAAGFRPTPESLRLEHVLRPWKDLAQPLLLLGAEGITNVDNMGGLFRNAAAFGVNAVVLDPTCCDPLYRKAIRVSMGHALAIPYAVCDDWHDNLASLRAEWGLTIVGLEAARSARPLWEIPRARRALIIVGSEGKGLSDRTLSCCDAVCEIPMHGDVPSLNVATAAAAALYEYRRGSVIPGNTGR